MKFSICMGPVDPLRKKRCTSIRSHTRVDLHTVTGRTYTLSRELHQPHRGSAVCHRSNYHFYSSYSVLRYSYLHNSQHFPQNRCIAPSLHMRTHNGVRRISCLLATVQIMEATYIIFIQGSAHAPTTLPPLGFISYIKCAVSLVFVFFIQGSAHAGGPQPLYQHWDSLAT